ncbi:MAG: UDP-N-acetylmuramate dehydrogenase [Anaerolineae bacterium]
MKSFGAALSTLLGRPVAENEPLARHTTFRIGGPADFFIAVESVSELEAALALARREGLPWFILGGGSNVLVADEGVRGLVIANRAGAFRFSEAEGRGILWAESGAPLRRLAWWAVRRGWGGLEWAVGIPGTVGGAVFGNAGAHGSSMANLVTQVSFLDGQGARREVKGDELGFDYRTSRFKSDEVLLDAELILNARPRSELEEAASRYMAHRRAEQPREPSAGSVFKNPPGHRAARLIEEAGLKGLSYGEAQVSEKHANFIVNLGQARAQDVFRLIEHIRQTVWEKFGVRLELEIRLVGEWPE